MEIERPSWSYWYNISNNSVNTFYFVIQLQMGSVCVHKKDLAGDNPRIFVKSQILSRHSSISSISEMCSAIPRLLEYSETFRVLQKLPEQFRVNSNISEAPRLLQRYSETSRVFPLQSEHSLAPVDIQQITQHAKKSRISAMQCKRISIIQLSGSAEPPTLRLSCAIISLSGWENFPLLIVVRNPLFLY